MESDLEGERERENDGAADCALDCEDRIRPSEAAISPFLCVLE